MQFLTKVLVLEVALACFCSAVPVLKKSFECPPADQIYPCTCSKHPRKIVKCDDVKNLDIVRKALEHRFSIPLPTLQITNVHSFHLPHHAFRNITAKKLVLNGSNIRRIHDDAFDGQDSLGLLILSEDRITDFPTEALKRLSGLTSLSLAGNFIMKMTDESIAHHHPQLRNLILADNRLSHIDRHTFPRTLESLSLSRNLLTELNGTLNHLNKLEIFLADNNRLTSVKDEFKGLRQLRYLELDRNNIFDIDGSFEDLTSLRRLSLAYNNLEDVEDGLYPLKKLQYLNLSYNYITELDEDLFKNLNAIETLDLSGNYLRNVCPTLKPLNLRKLSLSNINLNSLDYDCFKGMKNLQYLDLSQNELVNIDAIIGHSFPKMMFLHLQKNRLQFFTHGFKNLRNIYELDISDNNLSTIKKHHLTHNNRLEKIRIEGNPWDCSDHLLDTFRDLEMRMVQLIGAPLCYLDQNAL